MSLYIITITCNSLQVRAACWCKLPTVTIAMQGRMRSGEASSLGLSVIYWENQLENDILRIAIILFNIQGIDSYLKGILLLLLLLNQLYFLAGYFRTIIRYLACYSEHRSFTVLDVIIKSIVKMRCIEIS